MACTQSFSPSTIAQGRFEAGALVLAVTLAVAAYIWYSTKSR